MGKKSRAKRDRARRAKAVAPRQALGKEPSVSAVVGPAIAAMGLIAGLARLLSDPQAVVPLLVVVWCVGAWACIAYPPAYRGHWLPRVGVALALALPLAWVGKSLLKFTAPNPAAPLIRVEPQAEIVGASGAKGAFTVRLTNSGADVDHLLVTCDYFLAQKKDAKIFLRRIANFQLQRFPPGFVLRAHQEVPILLDFGGTIEQAYRAAKTAFTGHTILGVRVTVGFRWFNEGKDDTTLAVYEVDDSLLALSPPFKKYRRELPGEPPLVLEDVVPLLQSDSHWSSLSLTFTGTGEGATRLEVAPPSP